MNIRLLLPLAFSTVFMSCNGQIVTGNTANDTAAKTAPAVYGLPPEVQAALKAGIDPYFVESNDTVSTHGPRCITRDVLQDKKGNYWFATWQGIIGYDGKIFTNYTLKENLIHFHVSCCYEDKKGNLWFGTARGGVYRYDGKTFTLFTTKEGLADNNLACILEDKTGNMWFGTENGVSRYDGKSFSNFENAAGPRGKYVNSIIQDRTGKLWIGTNDGLFLSDGISFTGLKNKDSSAFKVCSLLEDKNGNIWIGRMNGLTRYDGHSFTDLLSEHLTYYMIEDKAGTIWLSHSEPNLLNPGMPCQVLYKYNGTDFIKVISKQERNDFQLFGKTADKAGNIWFGTMNGPCRYDGKSFTRFSE